MLVCVAFLMINPKKKIANFFGGLVLVFV